MTLLLLLIVGCNIGFESDYEDGTVTIYHPRIVGDSVTSYEVYNYGVYLGTIKPTSKSPQCGEQNDSAFTLIRSTPSWMNVSYVNNFGWDGPPNGPKECEVKSGECTLICLFP